MLTDFRKELFESLKRHFPAARIESQERRGVVCEARVHIDEETFIEVYFNAITGKKSFALISNGKRITGYDNYKFWHFHPPGAPSEHIPCDEPPVNSVILRFKDILDKKHGRLQEQGHP
jgi:hypothetical protein